MDTLREALDEIAGLPHDEECKTQMATSRGPPTADTPCTCHVGIAESALLKAAVENHEAERGKPVEHVAVVRPGEPGTVHFEPPLNVYHALVERYRKAREDLRNWHGFGASGRPLVEKMDQAANDLASAVSDTVLPTVGEVAPAPEGSDARPFPGAEVRWVDCGGKMMWALCVEGTDFTVSLVLALLANRGVDEAPTVEQIVARHKIDYDTTRKCLRGLADWIKAQSWTTAAIAEKCPKCDSTNYGPDGEVMGLACWDCGFTVPETEKDAEQEVPICDECGHPPARGNVIYEDIGRRPLCPRCNPEKATGKVVLKETVRDSSGRVVKIGRAVDRGIYETIILGTEPRLDATDKMRPCGTDLLCQEVVRQVLALSAKDQQRIREMLGTKNRYPVCDVAVRTR